MKIRKLAATAVLAVATLGLAAGTAHGEPAGLTAPAYSGASHGLAYETALTNDGTSISTTLDSGTFAMNGDAVTIADAAGNVIERLPLVFQVRGQELPIAAQIANDGRTLTMTPTGVSNPAIHDVGSQQWFISELQRAAVPGALVGAIIGGIIGFFFFGIGVIPGAIIGGLIGLFVAGGQPLIDSGFAYFSGQP
ncbi:DUF6861 domain-containing protein [Antrihabitans sp. YC2-6]|uniref:DUF6861 domain-containing protein n=1 Tax=Antrihabitans sp. YC2-6 TaxID=2799498 RepID=UPI0018F2FF0A|nr:hypothetical protein [Antrihabitans sp. YC2-6]MBJ8343473.1 hypothetical protein [Antrihabitans sp. YC2-6]